MSWSLVGDIGGTNCRFAVWKEGRLGRVHKVPTSPGIVRELNDFIDQIGSDPDRIVLSAAGVLRGNVLDLTNAEARLDFGALAKTHPKAKIDCLNDFESAAWAISDVLSADMEMLRGAELGLGPKLIVGIGTGFGAGIWTGHHAMKTEGGHIIASPLDEVEASMFEAMKAYWPETLTGYGPGLEVEAVVSGTGLPLVYNAYCDVFGLEKSASNASEVLDAAQSNDQAALATVSTFSRHLGCALGNLFVAGWTSGGIVLTGGVLRKNPWLLGDAFWQALNAGGRYTGDRTSVPVTFWDSDDIGLIGSGRFADTAKSNF